MVSRSVGYAYPWDFVGDPAAARRAAETGLDSVAVAASYHATRAGTPLHPDHRVVEAESAAFYLPVRADAWRGHRLVPVIPTWDPAGASFAAAHRALAAEGLAVDAWIVLTHNSALGRANPDLVARNAFGDRYPYALCPAAQDVQEYCLTLVQEALRAVPAPGVVLEACGPMGFDHAGTHEKTEFAGWDEAQRTLLSLCFCRACESRYAAAGMDSGRLAQSVRKGVDAGSPHAVEDCLGSDLAAELAAVRIGIATELRALLVGGARSVDPDVRMTVHGSADPWATGSFATLQPAVGDGVDTVVASCWDVATGSRRIGDLRALAPSAVRIGAYLRLDRDWGAGGTSDERLRQYLSAGMSELHLYHLGLLGRQGLAAMRTVIETTQQLTAQPNS